MTPSPARIAELQQNYIDLLRIERDISVTMIELMVSNPGCPEIDDLRFDRAVAKLNATHARGLVIRARHGKDSEMRDAS